MALSIGIVGLPNVGKSTLFNALTKKSVLVANYPFATIDPSVGVVAVPDSRREKLAALSQSKKDIPAAVEFVDIAGLVKGASEGEGLGNQFLSHIREVDAIAHVVRIFDNENIAQVEDTIDPVHDIELINTELALADIETKDKSRLLAQKPMLYVLNKESGGHNLDENINDERWKRLMDFFEKNNAKWIVVERQCRERPARARHRRQAILPPGVWDFRGRHQRAHPRGLRPAWAYQLFHHGP